MSRQLTLIPCGDIEVPRKDLPAANFIKCYGCRLTVPEKDTTGGFCKECFEPGKEDDTEKIDSLDKGPRFAERGGNLTQKTGLMPADA